MMKFYRHQQGIALIEVVVALFVMGFGLVALAMFGNGLFSESGQVKAKTEALQLAQQEIEQLREVAERVGLSTISGDDGSTPIPGVNASYTLVSSVDFVPSATDPQHATINVLVSWDDKKGSQSVSLNSLIAGSDGDALGGLVAGALEGGGVVDDPDGSSTYGEDGETIDDGASEITDSNEIPEGSKLYNDGNDYVLTDEEDNVLLRNKNVFSRVIGRVYIDAGYLDEGVVEIIPSDTGVCRKTLQQVTDPVTREVSYITKLQEVHHDGTGIVYDPETAGTHLYSYFSYTCFFGSDWYGGISIVRSDNSNTNEHSCGGAPDESYDGTDQSRHPQLMATRTFRGYTPQVDAEDIDDDGDLSEPLIDANGDRIYLSGGTLPGAIYGDTSRSTSTYDFLLTTLTGSETDSDCQPKLALSDNSEFDNNAGDFVCLETSDGANCPDTLPTGLGTAVAGADYEVSGSLSVPEGTTLNTSSLSLFTSQGITSSQEGGCTIENDLTWTCPIYIAGSQWSGDISLSSSGLAICSVDTYNYELDVVSESVSAPSYAFSLAESCSQTRYYISGTVENVNQNTSIDLTGFSVVGDSGAECRSYLGSLSSARDGQNIAEFVCDVPESFTGAITLSEVPAGHRIASGLDYTRNAVTSDLTGQVIQVR